MGHLLLALLIPIAWSALTTSLAGVLDGVGDRLLRWALPNLVAGTLLPLVVLEWLRARESIDAHVGWGRRDALCIAGALALGVVLADRGSGLVLAVKPERFFHVFAWLLGTSVAECLVFAGVLYHAVWAGARRFAPPPLATALAALASSSGFALYHFAYGPPWTSPPLLVLLGGAWLAVLAVYGATRSIWAAVAFNNTMATFGHLRNAGSAFEGPDYPLGLALAMNGALLALALWLGEKPMLAARRDGT